MATPSAIPTYMRIRQYVMSQVARGEANQRLLSVRELAKLYDVSVPTAMKALEQLIAEGILTSKQGVGTFINPNAAIRRPGGGKGCVGLIVSNGLLVHYDYLYMKIVSGIYDVLSETTLTTQLINSGNRGEALVKEIELLKLDGVIWANSGLSAAPTAPEDLEKADVRVVSINLFQRNISTRSVFSDLSLQGRLMAETLLGLGHSRIVWAIQDDLPFAETRRDLSLEGVEAVFRERGVERDKRLVLPGEGLATRLETLIDMGVAFTAVATAAELYPVVLDTLKREGLRVPEDVSIVTENSYATAAARDPVPTRVVRPLRELGETAARAMIELINGDRRGAFAIPLPWRLIPGETLAPAKNDIQQTRKGAI